MHHWHTSLFYSVKIDRSAKIDSHSQFLAESLMEVDVETLNSSRPLCFEHTNHKPFFETFKFIIDKVHHVDAISHYDLAFYDFFD